MTQTKLGGGRNWLKKVGRRDKLAQKVGRREIYPLFPPPPPLYKFRSLSVPRKNPWHKKRREGERENQKLYQINWGS